MAKRRADIRSYFKSPKPQAPDLEKGGRDGESQTENLNSTYQNAVQEDIKPNLQELPMETHIGHTITVEFYKTKRKYTVCCSKYQTVLKAIKSLLAYSENKCQDDQVILQLGQEEEGTAVPTHFPCSLLKENDLIVLRSISEKLEYREPRVFPPDQYSVFYIVTKGGENVKKLAQKKEGLFRSSALKTFTQLCVYALKGTTVRKALEQDGRFIVPDNFALSNVEDAKTAEYPQLVESLHRKTYKICIRRAKKSTGAPGGQTDPNADVQTEITQSESRLSRMCFPTLKKRLGKNIGTSTELPKTRAVSVGVKLLESPDPEKILNLLREQFPELRKRMLDRYPGDSFKSALKKVNFEKVQGEFSEVFRVRKLISRGESVCVLYIGDKVQGSGFVLVSNLILTNAHLLREALYEDGRTLTVPVTAVFNYEEKPVRNEALLIFETCIDVIDVDTTWDYAVLRLNRENKEVPPGLLPYFAPKPDDGGACLMGHPGGNAKKINFTYIIGKNERQAAADQQLEPYDDSTRMVIVQKAVEEGIQQIWCTDDVITYNTSNMFHGSSGSPLFDDECRVVGLHSGGFVYDYEGHRHNIIVYARDALDIFNRFVCTMESMERRDLLEDIKQRTKDNPHVMEIFRFNGLV